VTSPRFPFLIELLSSPASYPGRLWPVCVDFLFITWWDGRDDRPPSFLEPVFSLPRPTSLECELDCASFVLDAVERPPCSSSSCLSGVGDFTFVFGFGLHADLISGYFSSLFSESETIVSPTRLFSFPLTCGVNLPPFLSRLVLPYVFCFFIHGSYVFVSSATPGDSLLLK